MAQNLYTNMNSMSGHAILPSQMYPSYAAHNLQPEHETGVDSNISNVLDNLRLSHDSYANHHSILEAYSQSNGHAYKATNGMTHGKTPSYHMPEVLLANANLDSTPQNHSSRYQNQYNWLGNTPVPFQHGSIHPLPTNGVPTALNSSRPQPWLPSQHLHAVPELLEPRRTSASSREDPSPQTPKFGHPLAYGWYAGRTPSNFSSNSSPVSPQTPPFVWKKHDGSGVEVDFWAIISQEPPIPEPVPAIHSGPDGGRGTLDKILDNRDGTTNVYVRGLQPSTSDEMLEAYGKRFGAVVSCKSIIEASTGHCKGFGFIKYHNYVDAENCIRFFFYRGYEAKFARKSHNSRLKDLARADNTNLYVSNLPRLFNEEALKKLFQTKFPEDAFPHHQAGSCKILKDSCGVSRGVGFARFENPMICEEIIRTFNNHVLGEAEDGLMLQIRYADTEEQKQLKSFTAVKRQFKADEYNEAVYGIPFRQPAANGLYDSPPSGQAPGTNGAWMGHSPSSSASPSSTVHYPHSVLRPRQPSNLSSALRATEITEEPLSMPQQFSAPAVKVESPSVAAANKKASNHRIEVASEIGSGSPESEERQLKENTKPPPSQIATAIAPSPAKSML